MYLDVLFFVDFAMNTLLLIACARLTGAPIRVKRLLLGAASGGLATVVLWFLDMASPALPLLRAAVALLVTAVAFGFRDLRLTVTRACVLYAVSCALAGVIASIGGAERLLRGLSFGMLFFSGLAVCLFASLVSQFREIRAAALVDEITLTYHDRTVTLRALLDTGHSLVDPVTNRPVLVATCDSLRPLFPRSSPPSSTAPAWTTLPRCSARSTAPGSTASPSSPIAPSATPAACFPRSCRLRPSRMAARNP